MADANLDVKLDWGKGPFTVSPERRALHDQIIANPRDLALRHVYANLAIKEDDPRGEYVRLALKYDALDEYDDADERRALRHAMDDLYGRYARSIHEEWTHRDPLTRAFARLDIREQHGFPSAIKLPVLREEAQYGISASSLDLFRQCTLTAPLTRITTNNRAVVLESIMSAAASDPDHEASWSRLRELVHRTRIQIRNATSEAFQIARPTELYEAQIVFDANLTQSERDSLIAKVIATFPNLERVWIGAGNLNGLDRLGALPRLRKLCVAGQFTRALAGKMINAGFSSLQELILEEGARFVPHAVAEVTKRLGVRRLILNKSRDQASLSRYFNDAISGAPLQELVLRDLEVERWNLVLPKLTGLLLGTQVCRRLFRRAKDALVLPKLRDLTLVGELHEPYAVALARDPMLKKIERLQLGKIRVDELIAILDQASVLRELGADHAHRDLLQFIQFAPHLQQMRALRFRSGGEPVGLFRSPAARSLRRLSFGVLDDEMIHALTTSPELSALARLSLRFNPRHGPRLVSRFGPRLRNTSSRQLAATDATGDPWVAT